MKSCYVRLDRMGGIVELEAIEDIKAGDYVVTELDKGPCLGVVLTEPSETVSTGLKQIGAKAAEQEISRYLSLKESEQIALDFCRRRVREMDMPMKLLWAEYVFGGSKLLFYFVSESRVDFRELVKELAKEFKTRIELRQVGVRDEARIVGGLGNCGNVCCCRRFLHNFSIVSIKMVKEQGLALNPAKISGICGRLMCCLSYEFDMYQELKKGYPKVGKRASLPQGEGKVIKHNTLAGTITVLLDDGKEVTVPAKDAVRKSGGGEERKAVPDTVKGGGSGEQEAASGDRKGGRPEARKGRGYGDARRNGRPENDKPRTEARRDRNSGEERKSGRRQTIGPEPRTSGGPDERTGGQQGARNGGSREGNRDE